MTTITCKRCGLSFETEATTNTRCRRCRTVVRVSAAIRAAQSSDRAGSRKQEPPALLVLLLGCGHPAVYFDEGVRPEQAGDYIWTCDECGAGYQEARRVLGFLSDAEARAMSDDEAGAWFDSLLPTSTGSGSLRA